MAVTEFTVAISGAGKSYRRCAHYLATEFLPLKSGKIWTNFPIHIDAMVQYVVDHNPGLVFQDLVDRIKIIPEDELRRWRAEESGPWEFFENIDISGDRIALDEIHNFCPKESSRENAKLWKEFLGEMRHRGVEFECLSQNEAKVHAIIKNEAGLKRTLFNTEDRREPFFGVKMSDWYNLRAKFFTGAYTATVFEYEFLPLNGKWHQQSVFKFSFKPEFYPLYDSYSTPVAGGVKARGKVHPFQEHGHPGLLWWFFRRNWLHVLPRFFIVGLFIWVCFLGGGVLAIQGFLNLQKRIMVSNSGKPAVSAPAPAPALDHGAAVVPPPGGEVVGPSGQASSSGGPPKADPMVEVKAENDDLKKKIAALEAEAARASDVLLFGPDYLVMRDGQRLAVHEKIAFGPLAGHVFNEINARKRYALLDDGRFFYLSH